MDLPVRKQIRLSGYDYSQNGYYFVTICTQNRECILGNIINPTVVGADPCARPSNPIMKLNDVGIMVNKWLTKIPERFGSLLDIYQIMPNHIHLIIVVDQNNIGSTHTPIGRTHGSAPTEFMESKIYLGNIIQWFKTMSTNEYINNVKNNHWPSFDKRLWQRNYYEHVIRNDEDLFRIRKYIEDNPLQWDNDENNPNHPIKWQTPQN